MKPQFDFSGLRGRIIERYRTLTAFAKAMDMLPSTLSMKLRSVNPWKDYEIHAACELLGISPEEIHVYFFAPKF